VVSHLKLTTALSLTVFRFVKSVYVARSHNKTSMVKTTKSRCFPLIQQSP